jgi:hypothetical protein
MTFTERMPRVLRRAELVLSEEPIRTLHPVPLHGRPDQVYRLDGGRGELVVLDTKRGADGVVTPEMVIQLSVYATILRHSPLPGHEDARVACYGYVRFASPRRRARYERVTLWPDHDVVALHHRHRERLRVARRHWKPVRQVIDSLTAVGLPLEHVVEVLDGDLRRCRRTLPHVY